MERPTLKVPKENMAFADYSSILEKWAFVMDPPPWLRIADKIRIEIYKNQLAGRLRILDLERQRLQVEMEMLKQNMELIK
jgi:hypothetical protein